MLNCPMHYQRIVETLSMMYGFQTMHLSCIVVNNFASVNNRRPLKIITTQVVEVRTFLFSPLSPSPFSTALLLHLFFSLPLSVSIRFPALVVSALGFPFLRFSFFRRCFFSLSLSLVTLVSRLYPLGPTFSAAEGSQVGVD